MKQILRNTAAFAAVAAFLVSCDNKPKTTTETPVEEVTVEQNDVTVATWVGEYEGTVPCASCPGIKTEVKLNADNTYEIDEEYLEQTENSKKESKGEIVWSDDKVIVTLGEVKYKIGENKITMLDADGKEAEGENAAAYVLVKK
ncbi:copper resistance protein NlpE [Capnocytophaga sp. ARDL2]|uniref:copper resistance protein NlpE n=1 Tax=Capnocytophaga sp. ARDL2 TaxID=3238809 RepID=UPI003555ED52